MVRIEDFYEAAGRSGLLVDAEIDGHTIAVDFRSPDETVLDGLALSADYTIRFPASVLPALPLSRLCNLKPYQPGLRYRDPCHPQI